VALKIVSSEISHKSDVGGIALNVENLPEAEAAYDRIKSLVNVFRSALPEDGFGRKGGYLRAKRDLLLVRSFSSGWADLCGSLQRSLSEGGPINRFEAEEMISELKASEI